MSTHSSEDRLLVLDSLRGIAAIIVVLFHYTMDKAQYNFGFELGVTGVELFFMISGFVIFMSLSKVATIYEFIIRRIARLYPTYWVSVSFTLCMIILYHFLIDESIDKYTLSIYTWNMSMFHFYAGIRDLDGPYWTMIIEMLFYIFMIFLYQFKLLKFSTYIGLAISVFFTLALHFSPGNPDIGFIVEKIPLIQFVPLFFSGICFYRIYTDKNTKINYVFLLIFFICQVFMFRFVGRAPRYIDHYQYTFMLFLFYSLFILFVNNKLNFIVTKAGIFFGKISFALYLIHQFFGVTFMIPMLMSKFTLNFWVAAILITLPLTILIASVITFFIEVPVNKFVRRKIAFYKAKKSRTIKIK